MNSGPTTRKPFFRRRKTCPFTGPDAIQIDYKDVKLLQKFTTERGKIIPSRITAVSQKTAGTRPSHQARPLFSLDALRT